MTLMARLRAVATWRRCASQYLERFTLVLSADRRFLVDDGIGKEARFWKLAQSLSTLYPPGMDEKRWVDGVLARKKGL
jgi:hypothetical protein